MYWKAQKVSQMSSEQLNKTYAQLSSSRKAHIGQFRREADRARSLTGEWLLRQLLQQYWDISAPVILRQENGKPVLEGCSLSVSIAHSDDLVVCAADEKPIGIDTERCKPFRWALAERICTPEEWQYLSQGQRPAEEICAEESAISRFYEIWTGKEAWFKMLGTGLQDLRSVNVLTLNRQIFRQEDYLIQIVQM